MHLTNKKVAFMNNTTEEDYELNAYRSLLALIKKADYFKHKIYECIMLEIENEAFLKLQLGIYKDQLLLELKENLPYFEKVTKKEIKENNYPTVKQKAILNEKAKFEDLILSLTKEISNNHQSKTKISSKTTKEETRGPKTYKTKELGKYLIMDWNEKGKELFISRIKTKFMDYGKDFENGNKQRLNLLALALVDLKIMKTPKKKNQLETVLKAISGKKKETSKSDETNFRILSNKYYKSYEEYTKLKDDLLELRKELKTYEN
jgi:hypothetical protein